MQIQEDCHEENAWRVGCWINRMYVARTAVEAILTVWVALSCAFVGCGAVHLAARMPRQRPGRTSDAWH
jgi:hypothetical protein